MNFFAFSSLLTAFIPLILIVIIISSGKSKIHRLLVLCTLAISIWGFGTYLVARADSPKSALFAWRLAISGALYIPVFFYHIVCIFGNLTRKKTLFFVYAQAVFFHIITITTDKLLSNWHIVFNSLYYNKATLFYYIAAVGWLIVVFLGHYELWQIYKKSSGFKRVQTIYLLFGFSTGFLGGFLCLSPAVGINFYPSTSSSGALYAIIVTYAILRYRLLDIKVALTRAGIFVIVYTFILGIPFVLGYKYNLWQPATWIMLVLATSGPFIYSYFRRQAEEVMLKEQKTYQKALVELSKTMGRIRELDKLLRAITLTVVDKVKVSFAGIYLRDDEYKTYQLKHYYPKREKDSLTESVEKNHPLIKLLEEKKRPVTSEEAGYFKEFNLTNGLFIPCFFEDALMGFLILGSKPSSQMYTSDDLLVFETLSYSTSLAIENSAFWKEIEDRHRKARLQEMDTYSYSLAHEIDNPMQVVLGQAGLLKKELIENLTDEAKRKDINDSFDFIIEAAKRVSGMVKAIRDFGQKTTGELKPLNIEEVVESFSKLYYPQFKEKTVLYEKQSLLEGPVFVRGEKPELMQVLVILANNSIHAMTDIKEKKVWLILSLSNHDLVKIVFSDNGYGIKKEMLPIIFSPFTTTKASTEGTGMGLYNAQKIIERHKGKIWAESEGADKGASFFIELPIAKDIKEEEFKKEDKQKRIF